MDSRDRALLPGEQPRLTRLVLPLLIMSALADSAYAAAPAAATAAIDPASPAEMSFDQEFFPVGHGPKVDISRFEKGDVVLPGTYRGDIYVNKNWRARGDVVLVNMAGQNAAQPCFDANTLSQWGVDLHKVATHYDPKQLPSRPIPAKGQFCGPIGDYIPGATAAFDGSDLSLSLSIPQIYTARNANGYVDPSQWDDGVNALLLNYNTNVYRRGGSGKSNTSAYMGINASLDLGSWHLNHQGAATWNQHQGARYQNTATYLQHDIPSLMAQAQAGDVFTSGDMFDSVRLSGVRVFTDERMLPNSLRGFAPIVRGVASSNARVQIKQRGYVIYETTVSPGPFLIDDIAPTGYGGDLDVEVTEADGRIERFTVPFAATPQLLRPGQVRWEADIGKVNQIGLIHSPFMAQFTYRRGITNTVTAYGGATFATAYHAILGGAAFNTDVGAFSADLTQGRNKIPGEKGTTGLSLRLGYNKNIAQTGTNIAMAAYRYSTNGFVSLNDSVLMRDAFARGANPYTVARPRSRLDASIYQSLGDRRGQFYLTGSVSNYWNAQGRQVSYSAGYSNNWRSLTYSLSAQRTRTYTGNPVMFAGAQDTIPGVSQTPVLPDYAAPARTETTVWLSVSVPLGVSPRAPMFSTLLSHDNQSGNSVQSGVSGSFDKDQHFTYNASLSHSNSNTNGSLFTQYNGSKGNVSAGYSSGGGYHQGSLSATGAVLLHSGGVTLSAPTSDTVGLVYAPGAQGARVDGTNHSVIDSRGYAVMPYLTPYLLNTVGLDTKGAPASVQMDSTSQNVAPRLGTVSRLNFKTSVGRALLIDATMSDGSPLPFGADVLDENGNSVGVVGQAGRMFVHGLEKSGVLTVSWGSQPEDSCKIPVTLGPQPTHAASEYEKLKASCAVAASAPAVMMPLATSSASAMHGDTSDMGAPSASASEAARAPDVN